MKHLQLFEAFKEKLSADDEKILQDIISIADKEWFVNGDDPVDGDIKSLEDKEADNPTLQELLNLTTSGPGLTDVYLPTGDSVADKLRDGMDDGDIEENNRQEFSTRRGELLRFLLSSQKKK